MALTKTEIGKGYDRVAERIKLSPKFYRATARLGGRLSGRVLDLGCGQGWLLEELGRRSSGAKFFGIDLSWVLVNHAKQRNPSAAVCRGDAEVIPFRSEVFDVVFLSEVLEHLLDYRLALREIRRVLRPGGRFVVTVPNRDWICYDSYMKERTAYQPVDDHWFTKAELEGLLRGAGFRIEKITGGETLGQRTGFSRLIEGLAIVLNPSLAHRMKRLMIRVRKE